MSASTQVTHRGGCHCGAVKFEVDAPARLVVQDCNCSICCMTGYWHLLVPARHLSCRTCGIQSFYVPRSNPGGFSMNARCLDSSMIAGIEIEPFDGRHCEQSAQALRHLSEI